MARIDTASPEMPERALPRMSSPLRILALLAIAGLTLFVASGIRTLWAEYQYLRQEWGYVRQSAVIGFANIHPNPSYATRPSDWIHDDGEYTLLWAGWRQGEHQWFRVGRGEVDRARISQPLGRDVIQAIDYPMVETGGGTVWQRIPTDASVVGVELAGIMNAYPMQVLDKVVVVNDLVGDHALLILLNPLVPSDRAVQLYEPTVAGRRLTMGMSGYFLDAKPVLYDRGTESLWVERERSGLEAIAGSYKGTRLPQVGRPVPVDWGTWRGRNPGGRLLVGADRSRVVPAF